MQQNNIVGKLYISKTDYAIHKMEYTLYDDKLKLRKGQVSRHGIGFEVVFEVITEYKRKSEKMFPNYISFFNHFKAQKAPLFYVEDVEWDGSNGCLEVKFNDLLDETSGARARNYILSFRGQKITISEIRVRGSNIQLFPKEDDIFDNLIETLYSQEFIGRKKMWAYPYK